MSNMIDYLTWRGDLSFHQDPFNSVDALLLGNLSYVNFENIVPTIGEGRITIKDACDKYYEIHSAEEIAADRSFIKYAPPLMKAIAESDRYKDAYLLNYVSDTDTLRQIQFAAVEILTSDGASFISYRGTDDTVIAWKEDCYLSFKTVPAETEAAIYLQHVIEDRDNPVRLGGHSKGGHLAIYAAMNVDSELTDRIETIYNFDGPGFNQEIMELECFKRIQPKIKKYVPQTSLVGTFLYNTTEPTVVRSNEIGVMQHDPLSWQVEGKEFVTCEDTDMISHLFDDTVSGWLDEMDFAARKTFVDDLFAVLEASGCENVSMIFKIGIKGTKAMLEQTTKISSSSSGKIRTLIKMFVVNVNKLSNNVAKGRLEDNNKVLGLVAEIKGKTENIKNNAVHNETRSDRLER
ncbi:MAG: DUF2974 domain-containing protein [Saccharofermentans sp.]|nr:DUF2974 domain-containing protein [Saccharofermentans sp.]